VLVVVVVVVPVPPRTTSGNQPRLLR